MPRYAIRCRPVNLGWHDRFTFGPFPGPDSREAAEFQQKARASGFGSFEVLPCTPGMFLNEPGALDNGTYQPGPR